MARQQTPDMAIKPPVAMAEATQSRPKPAAQSNHQGNADLEELQFQMAIEASLAEAKKNWPPTKPPSRRDNSGKVSAGARLQQSVKKGQGRPEAVARCFGCGDKLVVPSPQEDNTDRESRIILGCGHVVGSNCLTWWIDRARDRGEEARCPHCPQEIVTGVL